MAHSLRWLIPRFEVGKPSVTAGGTSGRSTPPGHSFDAATGSGLGGRSGRTQGRDRALSCGRTARPRNWLRRIASVGWPW
ncbi:hypothetical protein PsYK624_059520 [Phanerochaete sordida]|uniref:Uncharacterized protein n=1 Tax=Phanerochaete sordida TaxID=48140 RepID=A0A9P3G5X7_9APHY|nr:hypothetical protein PsYK624_059520 [Phanerochaete sordida]